MEFGKYHFRFYISSTLVVLGSLMAIIWLNQTLQLLELIVSRGGSLFDFALMSILPMPLWVTIALPLACFSAVIWVMLRLSSDREIVVMQAVGMSKSQLALPALLFGTLMSLFLVVNSVYILPWSFSGFKNLQNEIRSSIPKILIKHGEFIDLDNGLTIFMGEKLGRNEIGNVFIQDSRNSGKSVTFTAQSGAFGTENGRAILNLKNGQRTELNQSGDASALLSFESHKIDISRKAGTNRERVYLDANEERIFTLLNPSPSLPEKYRREHIAEGHFRLISPFLPLTLSVIAVCMLGQASAARQRKSRQTILTALAGLGVVILAILARSSIADNIQSWPFLYVVVIGPIVGGLFHLYRPKTLPVLLRNA